jgi:hypothetical protein
VNAKKQVLQKRFLFQARTKTRVERNVMVVVAQDEVAHRVAD